MCAHSRRPHAFESSDVFGGFLVLGLDDRLACACMLSHDLCWSNLHDILKCRSSCLLLHTSKNFVCKTRTSCKPWTNWPRAVTTTAMLNGITCNRNFRLFARMRLHIWAEAPIHTGKATNTLPIVPLNGRSPPALAFLKGSTP